jgi:hypothetical protein
MSKMMLEKNVQAMFMKCSPKNDSLPFFLIIQKIQVCATRQKLIMNQLKLLALITFNKNGQ